MKKTIALALLCGLTMGCFAAETIYRGDSKQPKDVICYYQGESFTAMPPESRFFTLIQETWSPKELRPLLPPTAFSA